MGNDKIICGVHPNASVILQADFTRDERQIVKRWSDLWFITRAGKKEIGKSTYKYVYAKPTDTMEEGTGITKELVIVFSPYDNFEARSLSAYDEIVELDIEQRYEKLCYVLISADNEIENKLSEFISGQENQIVVPFSYNALLKNHNDQFYIRNQLRKYFFARDLFDYSEPLKRDFFFFGRTDVVSQIIDKHKASQNAGVFGLRKTGKTSIIYDVIRKSKAQDFISVNIDCQDPGFNNRRWYEALFYVAHLMLEECHITIDICEDDFNEKTASELFERYLKLSWNSVNKTILLMFDEIENITFGKAPTDHWCNGLDFVFFWQCVRSIYQKNSNIFTFCILGTNPKCVEQPTICEKDNPIFNMIQPSYISGFSVEQTREMVRKLGRIMGIRFDETIYSKMVEDYGGHPFLIRRVCSKLSQLNPERPVTIDRLKYGKAKEEFNIENTYFDMILNVLLQFYPDEYEMLKLLAIKDNDSFNYFVNADPSMVTHLVGYGLVYRNDNIYDFKIDAIRDYLIRLNNNHIKPSTSSEKWKQLCEQRNSIETRLRKMVRNIIRTSNKCEVDAKEYVIKKVFGSNKKLNSYSYNSLFDPKKNNIFLKNLFELIKSQWDYFGDYFGKQEVFISHMNILNDEGRFDAHGKIPEDSEMAAVDNAVRYLDSGINKYNETML